MAGENAEPYLSPFIPDGYTVEGLVPAVAARWSACRFRYRPMSADEESEVWAKSRLAPGLPMTRFYAELMAQKIIDWDVLDRDGKKLGITAENIKRLSPAFYDCLKAFIDGSQTVDQEKN